MVKNRIEDLAGRAIVFFLIGCGVLSVGSCTAAQVINLLDKF